MSSEEKMNQSQNDVIDNTEIDNTEADDQVVTPWKATCGDKGFNYKKLIEKFGVQEIDEALITRFEKVTGHKAHAWMRRGIFFAHRQLTEVLDDYEKGKQIILYTGRGPTSEALHLGHMVPFIFTKWLQDVFNAILVIQMADDEKYYFKDMEFEKIYDLGFENAKDIIACGFNPDKTFIFSNRDYMMNQAPHELVHTMFKKININTVKKIFGLDDSCNVGQLIWPIYQSAAAFSQFFEFIFGKENTKVLVAYAIDQDPYFRLARDVAEKMGMEKPCSIMTQFLPALEGSAKMSSTTVGMPMRTIFMTDNPDEIHDVIKKHAFSGGRETLKEHKEKGADLSVDMSYQYLRYFEHDDNVLEKIANDYGSGKMLTGEIKKILADKLTELVKAHQEKRNAVTDEDIKYFYSMDKFKR